MIKLAAVTAGDSLMNEQALLLKCIHNRTLVQNLIAIEHTELPILARSPTTTLDSAR